MKSKLMFFAAGLFLLAAVNNLSAQSARVDFKKVFEKYANVENLSITMEAYSYEEEGSEGKLEFQGSFKKRGKDFYTNAWDREMIVKNNNMIAVDHEDKKIVIGKARPDNADQMSFPEMSIDSLEAQGGKIEFVGKTAGIRHYKITMPDAMINVTELFLTDADIIDRVIYHYQTVDDVKPAYVRMDVRYKNVSFNVPPNSFFDEKKFVVKANGGGLKASPAFAAYNVEKVDYSSYANAGKE